MYRTNGPHPLLPSTTTNINDAQKVKQKQSGPYHPVHIHRMQKLSLSPGYFQSHMLVSRIAGERETVGTGLLLKQYQQHDLYTGLLIITGKHKYKDNRKEQTNRQRKVPVLRRPVKISCCSGSDQQ